MDYRLEIDISKELGVKLTNHYQQLIGTLRRAIKIGRLDILTELSCLLQHLCNPRIGHLHAVYSIFNYLWCNMNKNPGRIVFNVREQVTDEKLFDMQKVVWNNVQRSYCLEGCWSHLVSQLGYRCMSMLTALVIM